MQRGQDRDSVLALFVSKVVAFSEQGAKERRVKWSGEFEFAENS
jgi:hypothetical protein